MPNPKQYLQKEIIPGNNLSWDTDGVTLNADVPSIEANPQETPTDTLESLELDGTVYGLGGGTEVEANPSDPATDTLSTIDIAGTVYDLGGGTEVEANPSDPATDTLSTIDIAGTVYNIEGGGGGGISYDYYLQDGNIGGGPGSTAYATVPLDKSLTEGVYIAYTIDSNGTTGNTFFTWGGTNKSLTTGSITYTLSETAATATNYSGNWRDIFLTIFKLNSGGGTGGGGFSAPDYENPETITLVLNTWVTYNVTENGYIMVDMGGFIGNATTIKVNNTVLSADKSADTGYFLNSTYMFPVMTGDIVELYLNYNSVGYSSNTALFFPAKNSGGGGGGSATLEGLTDVDITSPTNGQGLIYDATNQKWINGNVGGGGGGSGSGYTETELWSGSATITRNAEPFTIPNVDSDIFDEYDELIFETQNGDGSSVIQNKITTNFFKEHQDITIYGHGRDMAGLMRCVSYEYISNDDVIKVYCETNYSIVFLKLIGVKYDGGGTTNLYGLIPPSVDEGDDGALYIEYDTEDRESEYETVWTGSVSTSAWASPVQIGTINPSEYYRIKITGTGSGERLVSEIPVVGSGDLWNLGHEMYIFTANNCTELWLYSSTGYSNTVTKIEATTYDNTPSSVEALYAKIEGKWLEASTGGGGSGGSGYSETELWSNLNGQSFSNQNPYSATLNGNISDYDMLEIEFSTSDDVIWRHHALVPITQIDTTGTNYFICSIVGGSTGYAPGVQYINDTTLQFGSWGRAYTLIVYKIIGIKFGGGSGGGTIFEGLDYSNSEDLTLPDNNGYDYTPTEDGALMITSYGGVGALGVTGIFPNDTVYLMHGGDRWTTSWCFVEKDVQLHLYRGSLSYGWASGTWLKFIPLKQSSSGGGGSFEVNYSTEEQKIGTWIDGKPLYEKTIHSEQTNISASGIITISDFTQADYSLKIVASKFMEMLYQGITWSDDNIFVRHDGDGLKISLNHGSGTFTKVIVDVVIRYTKTTD